jgi:hypothetical protein
LTGGGAGGVFMVALFDLSTADENVQGMLSTL